MAAKAKNEENLYGIGAVAKLTGLTDHTIRVWERRYAAVVAQRAANGRRVYKPADVEKLGLLKRLTDAGVSISQIAGNSVSELRERAQSMNEFVDSSVPERIRVAILGDFLPAQLDAEPAELAPVEVAVADSDRNRFRADLRRLAIDVVIMETPVLDRDSSQQLLGFMEEAGAERGVIVYSFGRTQDVELARGSRILVLRSPVNADELQAAVVRAYSLGIPVKSSAATASAAVSSPAWEFSGPVAPRRFNQHQLANLARASSAIDCECPHHLAQLVSDLSAFEIYSANCANRDEDDAALHRYLHQTTAQARAMIEVALQKVAEAEGLSY